MFEEKISIFIPKAVSGQYLFELVVLHKLSKSI